mgnify:CR=1 FL=1
MSCAFLRKRYLSFLVFDFFKPKEFGIFVQNNIQMNTLKNFNFKNKKAIIRVDFNVPSSKPAMTHSWLPVVRRRSSGLGIKVLEL